MIHSVKVTNHLNESIELILNNPETSEFVIGEGGIDGLGPEQTNINSTENQIYDGASFDSAITGTKNIVLHLVFYPNDGNIERVRHKCYRYFQTKRPVKLEFFTDERNLYIEGYVESNLPTIFEEREGADISIICMNPYFKSNNYNDYIIRGLDNSFQFPFCNNSLNEDLLLFGILKEDDGETILYNGELNTGVKMRITFDEDTDEVIEIHNYISNTYTGTEHQKMTIEMLKIKNKHEITINKGDYIIIDTNVGSKKLTLFKKELSKPLDVSCGLKIQGNQWITFKPGYNTINIVSSEKVIGFEIENDILYGGV